MIYVATISGVVAIVPDSKGASIQWQSAPGKGSSFVASPILSGDYLYTIKDHLGIVNCLDARTGDLIWEKRLRAPPAEGDESIKRYKSIFSASPVAAGDKLFFFSDEGRTFVLKVGPKFELLHVNDLAEKLFASPALVEGRWYFRTNGHLQAIGE